MHQKHCVVVSFLRSNKKRSREKTETSHKFVILHQNVKKVQNLEPSVCNLLIKKAPTLELTSKKNDIMFTVEKRRPARDLCDITMGFPR